MDNGLVPLDPQWVPTLTSDHSTVYMLQTTFKAKMGQRFELPVRLDKAGDLRINAGARVTLQTTFFTQSDTLYLRVTPTGTQIQRTPFKA